MPDEPEPGKRLGESAPFFLVVTVILGFLYLQAVLEMALHASPARIAAFTGLMLLHIALYWLSPRFAGDGRRTSFYLAVQVGLAVALSLLAHNLAIMVGLFPALVGITLGLVRSRRTAAFAILLLLVVAAVTASVVAGSAGLTPWAAMLLPAALLAAVYVILFTRQVEARTRAEALVAELEAARTELADYAAQVEDLTIVSERQRMARELHDTLAQGLAGLVLLLEAADSHLEAGRTERAREIVRQAAGRSRDTLADARRAIDDLRREPSPSTAWLDALRAEASRFSDTSGLCCAVRAQAAPSLPDETAQQVVRIVAEALSNVARHASATQTSIEVRAQDCETMEVEVSDDGIGFDPIASSAVPGHYGLLGMRERARLLGGSLAVISHPGGGTRVLLRLPAPGLWPSHGGTPT
jgi:NarL family two-component system sensor histidine kinase YdfH